MCNWQNNLAMFLSHTSNLTQSCRHAIAPWPGEKGEYSWGDGGGGTWAGGIKLRGGGLWHFLCLWGWRQLRWETLVAGNEQNIPVQLSLKMNTWVNQSDFTKLSKLQLNIIIFLLSRVFLHSHRVAPFFHQRLVSYQRCVCFMLF